LVVPWQVVAELDGIKANHKVATKRERARELLPLIESYSQLDRRELRPGITMEYLAANVEDICRTYDLTCSHPDHAIVATALLVQQQHGPDRVVLVTADTGMRMTARGVGLEVVPMPDSTRLPHAVEDEERERRKLEQELRQLQARRPVLSVGWGDTLETALNASITPIAKRSPDQLEEQVTQPLAKLHLPSPMMDLGGKLIENPRYADSLRRRAEFEEKHREYVAALDEFNVSSSLRVSLSVAIKNDGSRPASDIRLEISFPDFVHLSDTQLAKPAQPAAPVLTGGGSIFAGLNVPHLPFYSPAFALPVRRNASTWIDFIENRVVFHIAKLQHTYMKSSEQFFLQFNDAEAVRPFQVDYRLTADELPKPQLGKLAIVVRETGAN